MLSRILLPSPDAYAITDRQRASANGFLLDPTAQRNFVALQHLLPRAEWVPPSAVKKYRNISPAKFGVDKGVQPGYTFPLYTLFDPSPSTTSSTQSTSSETNIVAATKTAMINGVPITVNWYTSVPTTTNTSAVSNTSTTTGAATAPTSTPTSSPGSLDPAGTLTANSPAANTPAASTASTSGTTTPAAVPVAGQGAQTVIAAFDQVLGQTSVNALLSGQSTTSDTSVLTSTPATTASAASPAASSTTGGTTTPPGTTGG